MPSDDLPNPGPSEAHPSGGMKACFATYDWAATPVGPTDHWPQSLQTALSILLGTRCPAAIAWGPEASLFYNDGFVPLISPENHPSALGQTANSILPELRPILEPIFFGSRAAAAAAEARAPNIPLFLRRAGGGPESRFTLSCSAIRGHRELVEGVFITALESVNEETFRRLEEALRISEERFQRLAETNAFGLAIGDQHGGFSYGNPTLRHMLGYSAEEVARGEMRWDQLTPAKFQIRDQAALRQLRERGFCDPYEKAFIARNGRYVPVLIGASIIGTDKEGHPEVAVMISDLTLLKNTEAALQRQAEALRETDRRKDEFLAMLAHELRNPLASLQAASEVLHQPERTEDHLWAEDVIPRQIRHLSRLVDDLLDVSRITRGVIHLRRSRHDAMALLHNAMETVRAALNEHRHQLVCDFPPQPVWVLVDPARFEQIILNLLTNAIKYTPAGGRIELGARTVGGELVISVQDNGIGISPEKIASIWELFSQGERSIARSEGGLGIGLTIARSLAMLHHGSLTAESEGTGHGSRFSLRLPLAPLIPETGTPPASPAPILAPALIAQRILVVDDNIDTAQGLQRLLTRQGYSVRVAADGLGALECAQEFRPHIMLLDIGLPGMNGYAVARKLRQDPAFADLFLIAISGYGQEEDRRRSHHAGFDHHFVKPIDFGELKKLLLHGR